MGQKKYILLGDLEDFPMQVVRKKTFRADNSNKKKTLGRIWIRLRRIQMVPCIRHLQNNECSFLSPVYVNHQCRKRMPVGCFRRFKSVSRDMLIDIGGDYLEYKWISEKEAKKRMLDTWTCFYGIAVGLSFVKTFTMKGSSEYISRFVASFLM